MSGESKEHDFIDFSGNRSYEEVNYHYITYISELDSTEKIVLNLILGRYDPEGEHQKIEKECIQELVGIGNTKYKETINKFIELEILIKSGETRASRYKINKDMLPQLIKKNEGNLKRWKMYREGFYNVRASLPAPNIIVEGTPEEQQADEQMKKDADFIKKKKTQAAKKVRETNEQEREESIRALYLELNENCLNKFLSLYKFLQLREYGEALDEIVFKIREMKDPHKKDKKRFEKALDGYIALVEEGKSFSRGKYRNVNYKRNLFLKYLKNVTRPKFANCIKDVSTELANRLASMQGFMERANLMFKASKDPDFPVEYKSKLWHVFDMDGIAYIPLPYTENHVYMTYPVYDEKKYKGKE